MPSRAEVLAMAKGLVGGIEGTEARLEDVYEPTVRSLVEAHPWNFAVRSVKLSSATEYGLVASDSTALTAALTVSIWWTAGWCSSRLPPACTPGSRRRVASPASMTGWGAMCCPSGWKRSTP